MWKISITCYRLKPDDALLEKSRNAARAYNDNHK